MTNAFFLVIPFFEAKRATSAEATNPSIKADTKPAFAVFFNISLTAFIVAVRDRLTETLTGRLAADFSNVYLSTLLSQR
ncbi:MAG: hypothetical protein HYW01_10435 [Deltaproteobacteria bacterium]|nr:hypothetical protein [Deltaproteobacteria bacterium]